VTAAEPAPASSPSKPLIEFSPQKPSGAHCSSLLIDLGVDDPFHAEAQSVPTHSNKKSKKKKKASAPAPAPVSCATPINLLD
jgi:hypothetical protein